VLSDLSKYTMHRRSQGVQWVHLHPQGSENFFRRNLQVKCISAPPRTRSAPPQPEQELIFRTVFAGRVKFGGRSSTFWQEKVHPDIILATPMILCDRLMSYNKIISTEMHMGWVRVVQAYCKHGPGNLSDCLRVPDARIS